MRKKKKRAASIILPFITGRRFFRLSWKRMMVALCVILLLTAGILVSYSRNTNEPVVKKDRFRAVRISDAKKMRNKKRPEIVKIVK